MGWGGVAAEGKQVLKVSMLGRRIAPWDRDAYSRGWCEEGVSRNDEGIRESDREKAGWSRTRWSKVARRAGNPANGEIKGDGEEKVTEDKGRFRREVGV